MTLWGKNLGSSQGSSTITAGGVAPSAIYYWGNATPPACGPANLYNAYQKLQCVIFQIARTTPSGANNVVVTVERTSLCADDLYRAARDDSLRGHERR